MFAKKPTVKCEFCKTEISKKDRKWGLCWKCFEAYEKLRMIVTLYGRNNNGT